MVIQSATAIRYLNLALNNAKNVQKDLKGAKIEIVAYGPGIGMLKADSEVANRVSEGRGGCESGGV
jgi:intracellular sulfur oxidation DsrE/DsrF family protein